MYVMAEQGESIISFSLWLLHTFWLPHVTLSRLNNPTWVRCWYAGGENYLTPVFLSFLCSAHTSSSGMSDPDWTGLYLKPSFEWPLWFSGSDKSCRWPRHTVIIINKWEDEQIKEGSQGWHGDKPKGPGVGPPCFTKVILNGYFIKIKMNHLAFYMSLITSAFIKKRNPL